jgi:drug/metabolite transporter (DMT)-like permease
VARKGDLMVLAAALIWGLAYLAQKTAMADVGPLTFVASRSSIAALVLLPFALREGGPHPWGWMLAGGLAWFAAAAVQQTGMLTASVTNTAFLTALYVAIAPVLALFILRRPPGWRIWTGAVLALVGAFALSGGRLAAFGPGDWLVMASALGWAAYMLITEGAGQAARPLSYTAGVFAVVAALAWPPALWTEGVPGPDLLPALPEIAFVGVMSSAVTFGLMAMAMRHIAAPRAAVLLSTEALFAALFAAWLLGERLTPLGWLGAALILAAVLTIQTRSVPPGAAGRKGGQAGPACKQAPPALAPHSPNLQVP